MPIRAELTPDEIIVAPGDEERLTLTVESSDETAETYGFVATGLSRGWTTIEPPSMRLLPGASGTVSVTIKPPRLATVAAGSSSFEIKIFPLRDPDSESTVDGTLTILGFDNRQLDIAQPVLAGRRKARYDIVFDNVGNLRASTRLMLIDNTRRLTGKFDPPSLGVEPGMTATSRLVVRTRTLRWRKTRTMPFSVQAVQDNHPAAETRANFVQHPVISTRQTGWFFGLLAVAGLVTAGWFGVAKPTIDRAVDKSVNRAVATKVPAVATIAVSPTTSIAPSGLSSVPPASAPASSAGLISVTIAMTATPGTTFTQNIVDPFPAGKSLQITDIVFYNTNNDSGVFTVQRDNGIVEQLATENYHSSVLQLSSPVIFSSGQKAIVSLSCKAAGANAVAALGANASCASSVLIAGRFVDA